MSIVLATLLWFYRYAHDQRWDGDLFAVAVTGVAVKVSLMIWFRFTD
ncbi:MAG: hypothetical protein R2862_11365 [Thermoanaerobaculia bacterium]